MKIKSDWNWLLAVTIACTLLLPAVLLVASCGGETAPAAATIVEAPAPVACGGGLAAEDLSGQCRATPNATLGALEAVS